MCAAPYTLSLASTEVPSDANPAYKKPTAQCMCVQHNAHTSSHSTLSPAHTCHGLLRVHDGLEHGLSQGNTGPVGLRHLQTRAQNHSRRPHLHGALPGHTQPQTPSVPYTRAVQDTGALNYPCTVARLRAQNTNQEGVEHGQSRDACGRHKGTGTPRHSDQRTQGGMPQPVRAMSVNNR
jgi:hypothetical protein